jgi:hypothetical protein
VLSRNFLSERYQNDLTFRIVNFAAEVRNKDPGIRILNTNYHSATLIYHRVTKLLAATQLTYKDIEAYSCDEM